MIEKIQKSCILLCLLKLKTYLCLQLYGIHHLTNEEGSNASIMPPFLRTLITQNLKLKSQNKTIGYDLHHFIYTRVKNYDITTLFWLSSSAYKNVLIWTIYRR